MTPTNFLRLFSSIFLLILLSLQLQSVSTFPFSLKVEFSMLTIFGVNFYFTCSHDVAGNMLFLEKFPREWIF